MADSYKERLEEDITELTNFCLTFEDLLASETLFTYANYSNEVDFVRNFKSNMRECLNILYHELGRKTVELKIIERKESEEN